MIPGHGGIMDRFDCQFLMATFVNVYISSFIRTASPQKLLALVSRISFVISLHLTFKKRRRIHKFRHLTERKQCFFLIIILALLEVFSFYFV